MKSPFSFRVFAVLSILATTTQAQSLNLVMTPESIREQASQVRSGAMSSALVSTVFGSKRIELIKSAFHAPNLASEFTVQLSKLESSAFKDQIILMLLTEPWKGDDDGVPLEGSQPPPVLHNVCVQVLASRLPDYGLHVDDPSSIAQLSSLKARQKIAEVFAPLVDQATAGGASQSAPTKQPPNDGRAVEPPNPPPTVQPQASKAPEAKPTTATPSDKPTSSTPWSIIVVLIVAAGGLLWLLLKRRS